MTTIRVVHNRENPYVQLSRATIQKGKMSIEELGLWTHLMSLPNDWEIKAVQIAKHFGVGKDKIYSILNKLIDRGYVRRTWLKGEGKKRNQFSGILYEIFEEPQEIQKMFTERDFTETEDSKTESADITYYIDIHKNKQQQEAPAFPSDCNNSFENLEAVESTNNFFKEEGIESESLAKKMYGLSVDQIKKFTSLYKERKRKHEIKNPEGFISTALKEKWYEEQESKTTCVEDAKSLEHNKKLAENIEKRFMKHVQHPLCSFAALGSEVEIVSGQRVAKVSYKCSFEYFKNELKSKLLNFGFKEFVTLVCG